MRLISTFRCFPSESWFQLHAIRFSRIFTQSAKHIFNIHSIVCLFEFLSFSFDCFSQLQWFWDATRIIHFTKDFVCQTSVRKRCFSKRHFVCCIIFHHASWLNCNISFFSYDRIGHYYFRFIPSIMRKWAFKLLLPRVDCALS